MTPDTVRRPTSSAAPSTSPAQRSPARESPATKAGAGAGARIRSLWDRLSGLPGGKRLFSFLVGRTAPYTGTMGARVQELTDGYCRVLLPDRRKVRNHLRSVHAVALLNAAEMASGLGAIYTMDPGLRGIITHLEMDYLKKARGPITAECQVPDLSSPEHRDSEHRDTEHRDTEHRDTERREEELEVTLTDAGGELVATARARWLVGV